MDGSPAVPNGTSTETVTDFDAIVIGAGVSGLYQLYRLRELGMKVRVFEAATGVGGTWYWNRYPGARFDSESYSYGYSFSKDLLAEWEWSEHFAGQPETLRYLNYVADKFDLRRDIQFRSRATTALYGEETRSWSIMLEDGTSFRARFLITAIGPLSTPTLPRIEEREAFYEKLYGERGFGIWQGNFRDILTDRTANARSAISSRGRFASASRTPRSRKS